MDLSIAIYPHSFICTQLNGFKHYYATVTIQFNINHLFVLS